MRPRDRVYQGMTIAFDFSVEEIWVPWMTGATLVPKPDGARMLGRELHAFLRDREVTAMCCVPTLPRGRGLARCLAFEDGELAGKVSAAAFERGLLVETAGPRGEAVKLLPPLTITDAELDQGLELLADAVRSVC